jgi:hypothetical protein
MSARPCPLDIFSEVTTISDGILAVEYKGLGHPKP